MISQRRTNLMAKRRRQRDGIAVTEFALLAPLLVLITMAAIDVGQSVNVAQVVNDASREGARQATRTDVTSVDQVESAVQTFIADAYPGVPADEINSAVTVNVGDSIGFGIPGGDLTQVESGSNVSVQVILQFDTVRWTAFLPGFDGITIETSTVMRRD